MSLRSFHSVMKRVLKAIARSHLSISHLFACLLELSNLDNSHISTTNETHLDMLHNHRLCVLMSQGSLH